MNIIELNKEEEFKITELKNGLKIIQTRGGRVREAWDQLMEYDKNGIAAVVSFPEGYYNTNNDLPENYEDMDRSNIYFILQMVADARRKIQQTKVVENQSFIDESETIGGHKK